MGTDSTHIHSYERPRTAAILCHWFPRQGLPHCRQHCRWDCRLHHEHTVRFADGSLAAAGASATAGPGAALLVGLEISLLGSISNGGWWLDRLSDSSYGCGASAVSSHCAAQRLATLPVSADACPIGRRLPLVLCLLLVIIGAFSWAGPCLPASTLSGMPAWTGSGVLYAQ